MSGKVFGEPKQGNPKIGSQEDTRGPKPPSPSGKEVPDEKLDHKGGQEVEPLEAKADKPVIAPIEEHEGKDEDDGKAEAYDPSSPPQRPVAKNDPEDPGKIKKPKHVRGPAPGDRITY